MLATCTAVVSTCSTTSTSTYGCRHTIKFSYKLNLVTNEYKGVQVLVHVLSTCTCTLKYSCTCTIKY